MINEKASDVLMREMERLEQEKLQNKLTTDVKKTAFAEEIKTELGKGIKEKIINSDRHNPKKRTFWDKLKKALGC